MSWKLKLFILQSGRHQWEIARKLGWSESQFSRAVRGRAPIGSNERDKLAQILSVSRRELDAAIEDQNDG